MRSYNPQSTDEEVRYRQVKCVQAAQVVSCSSKAQTQVFWATVGCLSLRCDASRVANDVVKEKEKGRDSAKGQRVLTRSSGSQFSVVPPGPGSPGLKHSYSLLATLLPGRSVNSDSAQPGPVGGVTMAA